MNIYEETADVAFDRSFRPTLVTNFDFDAVDERLGLIQRLPQDAREQAAEALRHILYWIWGKTGNPHASLAKTYALIMALRPDIVGDLTYKQMGQRLGITRAAMSKVALNAQQTFGIKFARSRSAPARMKMAEKMHGNRNRRGNSKNRER